MKQNIDCSNLTFLIVDDNVHMRRIIRALVHSFGSRHILEAEDGAAGLEAFAIHAPHLVITDWRMPILDGIELTRMIRLGHAKSSPVTPIIMVSGYSEQRTVLDASNAGVSDFLLKPISSKRLHQGITKALSPKPKPAPPTEPPFGALERKAPRPLPPTFFDDSVDAALA